MNERERNWFKGIQEKRKKLADASQEDFAVGFWSSLIHKYAENAHFIYELLQNADDTGATYARFILKDRELIFAHDGKRGFSISNSETERADRAAKKLGDINALTGIGFSAKENDSNTIGKFGVGFKSVFQYTKTPRIYDKNCRFRIKDYIVPEIIPDDHPERKQNETLFVFPFDHEKISAEKARYEIERKLRTLTFPILFLNNLQEVTFETQQKNGEYKKKAEKTPTSFSDITAELITLSENKTETKLRLFSRVCEHGKYSVGFLLDRENNLMGSNKSAFCFFPTREDTGLKFIIHAPFLLTENRANIMANDNDPDKHNQKMIKLLAKLSADSLVCLRDIGIKNQKRLINDDIIDLIPHDDSDPKFAEHTDTTTISFRPFYTEIKEAFRTQELLPGANEYVLRRNAYWAFKQGLLDCFPDSKLAQMTGNVNARWVFTSRSREAMQNAKSTFVGYADSIINCWLNFNGIKQYITEKFIESQLHDIEWLHTFYKYMAEEKERRDFIKKMPVFLNKLKKAVRAFNDHDEAILYLSSDDDSDAVYPELLKNAETRTFFKDLGIREPDAKAEIWKILQHYKDGHVGTTVGEHLSHFQKIFEFYNSKDYVISDMEKIIKEINNIGFILCKSVSGKNFLCRASMVYFPVNDLLEYFRSKPDTYFVDMDEYKKVIKDENHLNAFLMKLGIENRPRVYWRKLNEKEIDVRIGGWGFDKVYKYKVRRYSNIDMWAEYYIDGCQEIINAIVSRSDKRLSKILWEQLLKIIDQKRNLPNWQNFENIIFGYYEYTKNGEQKTHYFVCTDSFMRLRHVNWLFSRNGELSSAENLRLDNIDRQYETSGVNAQELIAFLGIRKEIYDGLPDEIKKMIEFLERHNISLEDLEQLNQQKKGKENIVDSGQGTLPKTEKTTGTITTTVQGPGTGGQPSGQTQTSNQPPSTQPPSGPSIDIGFVPPEKAQLGRVAVEIARGAVQGKDEDNKPVTMAPPPDEDYYTRPTVDYSKKIEEEKRQSEKKIREICALEELINTAQTSKKYSYAWFKALLKLESSSSAENNAASRQISITFTKVELEKEKSRILVLKHPDRNIPQSMEELADIPLYLVFGGAREDKKVIIEVVNVQSYTLRVKLKADENIDGIDFNKAVEANIDVQSPAFLLENLINEFCSLGFDDEDDLRKKLSKDIRFVFGPPGTGKTTKLANVIIKVIDPSSLDFNVLSKKILVLTPTNKAADVLVRSIMRETGQDKSYRKWLIRFGSSDIEGENIVYDRTMDIGSRKRYAAVTTIARFPYDFILERGKHMDLREIEWDYVIIDEASMIPLINIIYPLYKQKNAKFIIAGDPHQIEPVSTVKVGDRDWKNENIFTMVGLNSFEQTETETGHKVKPLNTQYRSIEAIGKVYSEFAYGGKLKHDRPNDKQRRIFDPNDKDFIGAKPLNIIKFPVRKYESIYRPKRLQSRSSYHIYSALFTIEFLKYLFRHIVKSNEKVSIGIIAPYRAQADLVDKLTASGSCKPPQNVVVNVDTVHGFQGDECDIIIALFNPPPGISNHPDMFLNKLNIINVSISRARDYLFVLMPDDATENVGALVQVKRIEALCKHDRSQYLNWDTAEIEELIFDGDPNYIEKNAFSTSHQLVNVYGKSQTRRGELEMRYEVRSGDDAVDVQVHIADDGRQ